MHHPQNKSFCQSGPAYAWVITYACLPETISKKKRSTLGLMIDHRGLKLSVEHS